MPSAHIFITAVMLLLKAEGSAFVADAGTHGTYSRWGVTFETLQAYRAAHGHASTTPQDVRNLTSADATAIYFEVYWPKIQGPHLADINVACVMLNIAVLIGPVRATEILQGVLGVQPLDGIFGPKTLARVNLEPGAKLISNFVPHVQQYLYRLCNQQPARFSKYFNGWIVRTDALLGLAHTESKG